MADRQNAPVDGAEAKIQIVNLQAFVILEMKVTSRHSSGSFIVSSRFVFKDGCSFTELSKLS